MITKKCLASRILYTELVSEEPQHIHTHMTKYMFLTDQIYWDEQLGLFLYN